MNGNGNQAFYIAIGVAIAVHAALGGGLEAADRWAKEHKRQPPIVVQITPMQPPPKPPEPSPSASPTPSPETSPEPVQPRKIEPRKALPPPPPKQTVPPPPDTPPPPPDEPPPLLEVNMASTTTGPSNVVVNATSGEGNLKGSPDGVKGGKGKPRINPEGTPTGDPTGVPGGQGTAPAPVTLKSKPEVVVEVKAPYPDEALSEGIEGVVKLSVEIDETGKVTKVKVLKGLGYGLDEAAVAAMKKFKWKPAMGSDDKPMKHTVVFSYQFQIDE